MFHFSTLRILAGVATAFVGIAPAGAQTPLQLPRGNEIREVLKPQPTVETRIHEVLNGKSSGKAGDLHRTGDMVLDDVLGIIHDRGSVLDGSSLDPNSVQTPKPRATESADKFSWQSKRAVVAELLLKSSRLLEQIGARDPREQDAQADLIQKMRAEAGSLLQERPNPDSPVRIKK